jgi:hypothetical protein
MASCFQRLALPGDSFEVSALPYRCNCCSVMQRRQRVSDVRGCHAAAEAEQQELAQQLLRLQQEMRRDFEAGLQLLPHHVAQHVRQQGDPNMELEVQAGVLAALQSAAKTRRAELQQVSGRPQVAAD